MGPCLLLVGPFGVFKEQASSKTTQLDPPKVIAQLLKVR